MGITVFLLIWGPIAALLYFPLTTHTRQFRLAPADAPPRGAEPTPAAAKELHTLFWNSETEDHSHGWRSAA
jgi:hypothetical protein